jgi:glutaconate CoA-transferase subunit B
VAWDLRVAPDLGQTEPPTEEELHLLREELDPQGLYR